MTKQYTKVAAANLHYTPASARHPANTYFHFSFADYYDPENMNFGVLRVINDDVVAPKGGFDRHSHKDVEIVSYMIKGELTHWDSETQEEDKIHRGNVQTITAGNGVWHSELNKYHDWTRFLQIWIMPPQKGLPTRYENKKFELSDRENRLLHIVGNQTNKNETPLYLESDVNFYASELTNSEVVVTYTLQETRQAYINVVEGSVNIEGISDLAERDSLKVKGPIELSFSTKAEHGHFVMIEMTEDE
ncbi:pirin family protein [Curvivirga sp.]|uniref:pirin family protein n=1 Tax=Curvivirga sp. TaxID=2856848 RepID=UPI003B5A8C52